MIIKRSRNIFRNLPDLYADQRNNNNNCSHRFLSYLRIYDLQTSFRSRLYRLSGRGTSEVDF